METNKIVYRDILKKWGVEYHEHSAIHTSGMVIPAGNWEASDPFLIMAEDVMKNGAFDHHPHRGIETVTYIIDGEMEHFDNKGGRGTLRKGDAQWLTAGRGVLHLEEAPAGKTAHSLQLWVNLPAESKMVESSYQDILRSRTPVVKEEGVEIFVISGSSHGVTALVRNHVPVTMLEINLEAGYQTLQKLPADYNGFLFVIEGEGEFGCSAVKGEAKEVLWLTESVTAESEVSIKAKGNLKVLLIAGKKLREPVVARGPFVMNTVEQINQAYQDFRNGKFGDWEQDVLG
ncbi:pirin family protein [Pedobacter rhodius]|uniref:Pirin family protein n=1 Tax=Pedobacter rhodius TaxID=3004098 RepID=A0ABT4L1N6_9SPHI|nr:pirin family protein [Pedobacter sp. SJ11]MCZ4225099.1 pirin family protein [Pedobacter sp. SJ11]